MSSSHASRRFDHVDLRVPSLQAAIPFYARLLPALGFTRDAQIEGWFQLESESGEFVGVTEDAQHVPNQNRIAFRAANSAEVDSLAALLRELRARNIEGPEWIDADYYAVFFEDPCGNRLEFVFRKSV
jgi:catechol 2,3-dioxygenase-like lactoylglutathione lyase family enzyme